MDRRSEKLLLREELETFVKDSTLSVLSVAFSRDSPDGKKIYVQDKIREKGSGVAEVLTTSKLNT